MIQDSLEVIIQIRESLAKLTTQVEQVLNTLSNHEMRLARLEEQRCSLKDSLVGLLVKGLVGSILIIGTLTGSAGLIQKVLSNT